MFAFKEELLQLLEDELLLELPFFWNKAKFHEKGLGFEDFLDVSSSEVIMKAPANGYLPNSGEGMFSQVLLAH